MLRTLVMEAENKSLALSLVQSHLIRMHSNENPDEDSDEEDMDLNEDLQSSIRRGKGGKEREKGLMLLLDGGPGTGKTFAATCIAETVKSPILSDTIGIRDSSSVERKLSKMFQLAQRWRAILVIENAEAFLTQRSKNEAGFSAVALAIRAMDSYTGILILTTSRAEDLDGAILSYTDLAINFPPLQGEQQQKVWGYAISEYKVGYYSDIMGFIEEFCKKRDLRVNGRDIRNITLAANHLARHEKKFLEVQHIRAVLENRTEFIQYINRLRA